MQQDNPLVKLVDLKTTLMDVIESAFAGQTNTPDVAATQQMGVNLTNAVKREGVTIIQNQSVEVYARIMPPVIRAIKICDAIETTMRHALDASNVIEVKALPQPANCYPLPTPREQQFITEEEDHDPIEACCDWLYENRINWHEMQSLIKKRYLDHVIGREGTKAKAARRLEIGPTYISKICRDIEEGHA